jgi:hypothetical protein
MKSTSKGVVSGRPRANSDPRIAQQSRLLTKPHSAPPDIQVFLSPAHPIIEYETETGPADPNDISRTASTAPPRNDHSIPSDPIDSMSLLRFCRNLPFITIEYHASTPPTSLRSQLYRRRFRVFSPALLSKRMVLRSHPCHHLALPSSPNRSISPTRTVPVHLYRLWRSHEHQKLDVHK